MEFYVLTAAGRLAAERSEATNQPKHIKPFLLRIT
jgi:hypothetical protein